MVCRKDNGGFDLQEYFAQPELYESINDSYLEFGHLYMNTIYWSPANPTFVSKKRVHELYASGLQRPLVVGDITCDIEGSVEFNIRATDPGNPIYTWDPIKDEYNEGYDEPGVTVLAVDNLPCEFPRDSSGFFCDQLMQLSEELLALDVNNLGENVPEVLNNALICHSGKLTEKYEYLKEYLN
jgi:alpha-aminoadipic semialdehyde synthase